MVCGFDPFQYYIGGEELIGLDYQWSPAIGLDEDSISNPLATISISNKYYLTVTDEFTSCTQVDSVSIEIGPSNIELVSPIIATKRDRIVPQVIGLADSWKWNPPNRLSCDTCAMPEILVQESITYNLQTFTNGCFEVDTLEIIVDEPCLQIPNVFTPNGDGINDYFYPDSPSEHQLEINKFIIYNRWGEKLYDAPFPWNGKSDGNRVKLGVYTYFIEANCDGAPIKQTGFFTLFR